MDTRVDMGPKNWTDWAAAHPDATDDIKLAALRNYIEQAARAAHADEPDKITAAWVNKKFGPLGIASRIGTDNAYVLEVPVNVGPVSMTIHAPDRATAIREFMEQLDGTRSAVVSQVEAATDPTFLSGPEDPSPTVADDAPTTVDATLVALRETILLAVIAGPRICESGANQALADFGLGTVPDRSTFTVTRPATGTMKTTVAAYDEASAQRVAEWRWEDNRKGYTLTETDEAGDFEVTEIQAS